MPAFRWGAVVKVSAVEQEEVFSKSPRYYETKEPSRESGHESECNKFSTRGEFLATEPRLASSTQTGRCFTFRQVGNLYTRSLLNEEISWERISYANAVRPWIRATVNRRSAAQGIWFFRIGGCHVRPQRWNCGSSNLIQFFTLYVVSAPIFLLVVSVSYSPSSLNQTFLRILFVILAEYPTMPGIIFILARKDI